MTTANSKEPPPDPSATRLSNGRRQWARKMLGLDDDPSPRATRAALLDAADPGQGLPSDAALDAFLVLEGRTRPGPTPSMPLVLGEELRLFRDAQALAARWEDWTPDQRRTELQRLAATADAYPRVQARLAELHAAADVPLPAALHEPHSRAGRALAGWAFELFPLAVDDRARRRQEQIEQALAAFTRSELEEAARELSNADSAVRLDPPLIGWFARGASEDPTVGPADPATVMVQQSEAWRQRLDPPQDPAWLSWTRAWSTTDSTAPFDSPAPIDRPRDPLWLRWTLIAIGLGLGVAGAILAEVLGG